MARTRFFSDGRMMPLSLLVAAPFAVVAMLLGTGRPAEIAGTIETRDFVIPAGAVVTAVRDVTITASHAILIEGALYAAPGANIAFKAPSIRVSGTVKNLSARVNWWRREVLVLDTMPAFLELRIDRLLGRTPRYWSRGQFDCFYPPPPPAPSPRGN